MHGGSGRPQEVEKGGSLKGACGTEGEESREPMLRDVTGIQTLMEQQDAGELKQREEVTWQEQQFRNLETEPHVVAA